MKEISILCLLYLTLLLGCDNKNIVHSKIDSKKDTSMKTYTIPSGANFNDSIDKKKTDLYILKNKNISVAITNYGGRIVSLMVPDNKGMPTDVVVGFSSVKDYIHSTEPYFGATIGRYGNRIAKGVFKLDGKEYHMIKNNGPNTLHGGKKGFQDVVWDVIAHTDSTLELFYLSKDGEEGFPGNLSVNVSFSLSDDNSLAIEYKATSDKKTVLNLTNHAFFNLNGEGTGTILNHRLTVFGDKYTPVDSTLIPNGKIASVQNTPFDFTTSHSIGSRIDENDIQLKNGNGYDHNFVLNDAGKHALHKAALIIGEKSGIKMEVNTTEPGLQFYSGNFMKSKNTFKSGSKDDFRTAFCLETQHFPDAPNQPGFPSTVLAEGQQFNSQTVYKFSLAR